MLIEDTLVHGYDDIIYYTHPQQRCVVVINDDYLMYYLSYDYEMRLPDDVAQRELANGFAYIMKNHINRANGNIVQQLHDLFDAYRYPFRDFYTELSCDTISIINIDLGDRNDFLAFIERLKQEDTLPGMPTEAELLQFLNKGDD